MVPACSDKVPRVSPYSGYHCADLSFAYGAFTSCGRPSQTFRLPSSVTCVVRTPECTHSGLGSSDFARRYFRNHFCFLFLRLLRCFSSPGSLRIPMDSVCGTMGLPWWVSPFGDLRVDGYLLLTAAFRSLSRPSSALSAKASSLCSLWLCFLPSYH